MDMTFGSLGTLPDDLIGKCSQKLGTADEIKPASGRSELSDVWADYMNDGISLVNNTGAMADRPPETTREVSENIGKIFNDARKIMMKGGNRQLLKQFLSFALGDPIKADDSRINELLCEFGLIGNVYLDRKAFENCDDLKYFWRKYRNPTAEFLLGNELCRTCEKNINFCPKAGLRVVESIDYTPELLERYKGKLSLCGKCGSGVMIENKEQLRKAFLSEPTQKTQSSVAPKAAPKSILSKEEITTKLENEARRKADDARGQLNLLEAERELKPVLRYLQELLLTGSDLNTVRDSFERKGFPRNIIEKYAKKISILLKDEFIRCGLKINPELYERCEDFRTYLSANKNIRPKFVVKTGKCPSCNNNNGIGCRLFGTTFIEPGAVPPVEIRQIAINNFKEKSLISQAEVNQYELIEQFQPGAGIKEALQLIDKRSSRSPLQIADVSGQLPASQKFRFRGEELMTWQCMNALNSGVKLSSIEKKLELEASPDSVASIINSAVSSLKTVTGDQLDYCMVRKYPLNPDCNLVPAEKCSSCKHGADKMYCKVQRLAFRNNVIDQLKALPDNNDSVTREIQSYFEGCEMTVDIDPRVGANLLEIEMPCPGEDLVVDSGSRTVDPTQAVIASMGSAEMVVEIDPPRKMERPLKIGSLGPNFDVEV
jgi:hypothetical protein